MKFYLVFILLLLTVNCCEINSYLYKIPIEFTGAANISLGAEINTISSALYDDSSGDYFIYFEDNQYFDRAIIVTKGLYSEKIKNVILIKDLKPDDYQFFKSKKRIAEMCSKKFGKCHDLIQNLSSGIEKGYYSWVLNNKIDISLIIPNTNNPLDYAGRKFPLNILLSFEYKLQ